MTRLALMVTLLAMQACDTVYFGDPTSCRAIKESRLDAQDGVYLVDLDGAGARPAQDVYCDMTTDGGGWTLVTRDLVADTLEDYVEVTEDVDLHQGIVVTVKPTITGCTPGEVVPHGQYQLLIGGPPGWTELRASYAFSGDSQCWSIFGDLRYAHLLTPNVVPFTAGVDIIREAVRMGGQAGDAYNDGVDGRNWRCDTTAANFWSGPNGRGLRSATVILRRSSTSQPAGLSTGADCTSVAPDTYWRYSDVYVR